MTRTTVSSITSARRFAPASRDAGPVDGGHVEGELYAGGNGFVPGSYGLGATRADAGDLAVEQGRLGVLADLRSHLDHPFPGNTVSACASRTSRRGAAPYVVTSPRAFDFEGHDGRVPHLPSTTAYEPDRGSHGDFKPTPPANQQLPRQERGQRPARPLGYALEVTGALDQGQGKYILDFDNAGDIGACFQVNSSLRSDGPWTYTVEAGKSLSDYWTSSYSGNAYDLTVLGPNGFLRRFSGKQPDVVEDRHRVALPEVTMSAGRHPGELRLVLANDGGRPCAITIEANAYQHRAPRRYWLEPGEQVDVHWDVTGADHWYDLVATSDADPLFLRRFAGHRETGRASMSDPAFGD